MEKNKSLRRWLWYFSLLAAGIVLYKTCGNLQQLWNAIGLIAGILTPFIAGLIIAFLLYGPSNWLENRFLKHKGKCWKVLARPLALTIVYIVLLGLLALFVWLVIPRLVTSVSELVKSIPAYWEAAQKRLADFSKPGGLLEQLHLTDHITGLYEKLQEAVRDALNAKNVLTAVKSIVNMTTTVVDVIIAFIVSVYMLAGRERLLRDCKTVLGLFVKPARLNTLCRYGREIGTIFHNYFYGAFLDALLIGVVASIGLTLFGVPYSILLGMFLGILNMIPYFGSVIGGIVIVLVTLLTKNIYFALGVAVFIVVIQQIDGNIVQPRIVGGTVGIRPIYVLLGITLFGGLFGFWGIFLGVPLMATIQLLVKDAIARRKDKPVNPPPKTE